MNRDEKVRLVARWRANRMRERISVVFWFVSFAPMLFLPQDQDRESMKVVVLTGIFVVSLMVSVGLTMYFHERTSACPLCHEKFADSEEYNFGDSPGLSLADTVENCPFCGENLDKNNEIERKSSDDDEAKLS